MTELARRYGESQYGDSFIGRTSRDLRRVRAAGAVRRQEVIEGGKILAAKVDVLVAGAAYATERTDELIQRVRDKGVESERTEMVGGRYIKVVSGRIERLLAELYGPFDD